jgi:hypothetical protein
MPQLLRDVQASFAASASDPSSATGPAHASAPHAVAESRGSATASDAPAVHAASRTRTLDTPATPAPASATTGGDAGERGTPTADVDALARQVYDVLKRRLAAERRRGV